MSTPPGSAGQTSLTAAESQLIHLTRLGFVDSDARTAAVDHLRRMWPPLEQRNRRTGPMLLLALAAGLTVRLLFFAATADERSATKYAALVGPLVAPWVFAVLVLARPKSRTATLCAAGLVAFSALFVWLFPYADSGSTRTLTALHLPILLWCTGGPLRSWDTWHGAQERARFLRLTGEVVLYFALLACAGVLLIGLGAAMFEALSPKASAQFVEWVLPLGIGGGVVVASWLADTSEGAMARIAETMQRAFIPLFTALLTGFTVVALPSGFLRTFQREQLGIFTALLVVVTALAAYAVSGQTSTRHFVDDWLLLAMTTAAVIVDLLVLSALLSRLVDLGATPNRVAITGLNFLLLINLIAVVVLQWQRIQGRGEGPREWLRHLPPGLATWSTFVAFGLPVLFTGS